MPAGNKTRVVFRLWLSHVHINLDLSFIGAQGAMELNVELHYYCFTFGGFELLGCRMKELGTVINWMFHLLIVALSVACGRFMFRGWEEPNG